MGTPYKIPFANVIADISLERTYQEHTKGFTPEDDDELMPHQWSDLLDTQMWRLDHARSPEAFRKALVKIAAVAVAAIEAHDRAVH